MRPQMNLSLLQKHIDHYQTWLNKERETAQTEIEERNSISAYYKSFTEDHLLSMTEDEFHEYLSKLWAMLIWGNKRYVTDKMIETNGLPAIKKKLAELVWGKQSIETRWDSFRRDIKGMGPAMISEILCKTHPDEYLLWNRRALVGFRYLEATELPRHDYQLTGKVYTNLCSIGKQIASQMRKAGIADTSMLSVDYFIWTELQVEDNLSKMNIKKVNLTNGVEVKPAASVFLHNEIRDKLRDIGQWLGFASKIEQKVADGSQVDTVWEATIGNMGRVIYVFEVQTKGSIDSLLLNLLKSLNNPAVQGVVAVSDKDQLERIKKHAKDVVGLRDKLKYWDYEEVLKTHESLEYVNAGINQLGLVPQGF